MDLSEITLEDLVDAIADRIVEKMGGTKPSKKGGAASATTPPDVDDGEADDAPVNDAPAEEVADQDDDEDDEDVDLVLKEQLDFVDENAGTKPVGEMREELKEFYEGFGDSTPEDIAKEVSALKGESLKSAYKDYLARLVTYDDDGEIEDFLQEWGEPYRAKRLDNGEEVFHWVKDGMTLTDDEAEEADLGDPNPGEEEEEEEPPARKPPTRTRKPKGKKK